MNRSHEASPTRPASPGFTLIEVSLALLVVAIGVLGAFSLFPHGLAESRMAVQETQSALFGEMVLRSYRAAAIHARWLDLKSYTVPAPGAGLGWASASTIQPNAGVQEYVTTASIQAARDNSAQTIDEIALRYDLSIQEAVTNRVMLLTLQVWPGRYGNTATTNAKVYITKIYNQR